MVASLDEGLHFNHQCDLSETVFAASLDRPGAKQRPRYFGAALHLTLQKQTAPLVPTAAEVVFLADGEFNGCQL